VAFEVVPPSRTGLPVDPLTPGTASLSRQGCLTIYAEDLALVKITDVVVLLADHEAKFRVGLRRPREKEDDLCIRVRPLVRKRGKADPRRRRINMAPAVRALGLAPGPETAGRYEVRTVDDLLILNLAEASVPKSKR